MIEFVRGEIIGEITRPFRLYVCGKQVSPATDGRFDSFRTTQEAIEFYLANFPQLKTVQGEVREYDV